MTRVAVVVLTWNGREDTVACLQSLRGVQWRDLDVIVADNASEDGTEEAVRAGFPEVHVVQNGANLGFAEGNNRGIAAALERGADAVLILNNDTTVPSDLIASLVDALADDVGAVCPVLRYPDGRIWFAGSHYDPRRARAGRLSDWETGARRLPSEPVEIDRAVGAAMLVTRAVIERLGCFVADLFYLYEDVEWSLRMRRDGLRILLDPRVTVEHHVAASQGGTRHTPLTLYYGTRNDLEVGRRYGAEGLRREAGCAAVHVGAALRHGTPRLACARAAIAGWRDYRQHRLGPRA
jgi:GT2 family glycosyltransferase